MADVVNSIVDTKRVVVILNSSVKTSSKNGMNVDSPTRLQQGSIWGSPRQRKYIAAEKKTKGTSTSHLCEICSKEFKLKISYIRHLTSHVDSGKNICAVCGKAYKHPWHLAKHVKVKHPCKPFTDIQQGEIVNSSDSVGGSLFKCSLCNKIFPYKSTYKQHMNIHKHNKQHRCTFRNCNKAFYAQFQLNEHLKGHTSSFSCEKCNKSYASRSSKKYHQKRCSAKEE